MTSFEARTHIAAEPSRAWDTLVRTEQWPDWDPALERVEGTLAERGRVTVHVEDQSRPFELAVADWQPGRRLVLRGGLPLGLFAGTRTYDLSANGSGTDVVMAERYTGLLAATFARRLPDLQPSFESFVAGWRDAAEGGTTGTERADP